MSKNFKKTSEILHSKNNIDITNKLKEDFSYLENVNISEIHDFSKLSTSKESYERQICTITGIDCTNRKVVNHSLWKHTAQKLNDEGLDSQAIMNITLNRSLAGLNS